jgi:heme/copper-type cytochrome/quinol oxidase subunit 1
MLLFELRGMIAQLQATLQPNLNHHNTMWAPGHSYLAVVVGTTPVFTIPSHHVAPLLTRRKLYSVSLARLQIHVSFTGILVIASTMAWLDGLELPEEPLHQGIS